MRALCDHSSLLQTPIVQWYFSEACSEEWTPERQVVYMRLEHALKI